MFKKFNWCHWKPFHFCDWEHVSIDVVPTIFSDNITLLEKLCYLWLFLQCLQEELVKQKAEIAEMQEHLKTLDGQVEDIYSKIATINNTISDIQSNIRDIQQQLIRIENKVNKNTQDIAAINTELTNINNRITTLSNSLSALTNRVSSLERSITALQNTVTVLQSDVATLKNNVNTLTTAIQNIETNLTSLSNTINSLNTRVTNVENNLEIVESEIGDIDVKINDWWSANTKSVAFIRESSLPASVQLSVTLSIIKLKTINLRLYSYFNGGGMSIKAGNKTQLGTFVFDELVSNWIADPTRAIIFPLAYYNGQVYSGSGALYLELVRNSTSDRVMNLSIINSGIDIALGGTTRLYC